MKISVTTPKPQNKKIHALSTLTFLSMLQYSHSYEFLFTFFVSDKIGSKVLSGTFFRIGLSFLEAEIWRFLWWHLVGYSLYITLKFAPVLKLLSPGLYKGPNLPEIGGQIESNIYYIFKNLVFGTLSISRCWFDLNGALTWLSKSNVAQTWSNQN